MIGCLLEILAKCFSSRCQNTITTGRIAGRNRCEAVAGSGTTIRISETTSAGNIDGMFSSKMTSRLVKYRPPDLSRTSQVTLAARLIPNKSDGNGFNTPFAQKFVRHMTAKNAKVRKIRVSVPEGFKCRCATRESSSRANICSVASAFESIRPVRRGQRDAVKVCHGTIL
jgi:hypothetical protein